MRKSVAILTGIFVCALTAFADVSHPNVSASASSSTSLTYSLSPVETGKRISDARELLQSTAVGSGDAVRLALLDTESGEIGVVAIPKDEFLTRNAQLTVTSEQGAQVGLQILRANGVNTAVNATDAATGRTLIPLLVQYPIVKTGAVTEVAYYTSAHPALLSEQLTAAGQSYVRERLDQAASELAARGVVIPADIVDIAEHLCVVEHTDHKRFMTENQQELFPEILSLYALNEGSTFRYSVSTAGAGGMIQMIPKTYAAIREQHPTADLNADFVDGMRDHSNAAKAMLLYMNQTWEGLARTTEVQDALTNGIATKPELLAAGYNSNPTRLPQYLKNGGTQWRTLIPAETQMYLAIYGAVDRNLAFRKSGGADESSVPALPLSIEAKPLPFLSWLGQSLLKASPLALF